MYRPHNIKYDLDNDTDEKVYHQIKDTKELRGQIKNNFYHLSNNPDYQLCIQNWIKTAALVSLPMAKKLKSGFFSHYKDYTYSPNKKSVGLTMEDIVKEYGGNDQKYLRMFKRVNDKVRNTLCLSDIAAKNLDRITNFICQYQEKLFDNPPSLICDVGFIEDIFSRKENDLAKADARAVKNKKALRDLADIFTTLIQDTIYFPKVSVALKKDISNFSIILKNLIAFTQSLFRFENNKYISLNPTDCVYEFDNQILTRLYYVETVYDANTRKDYIYIHCFEKNEEAKDYIYICFESSNNSCDIETMDIVQSGYVDEVPIQVIREDYNMNYTANPVCGLFSDAITKIRAYVFLQDMGDLALKPPMVVSADRMNLKGSDQTFMDISGGRGFGKAINPGMMSVPHISAPIPGVAPTPYVDVLQPFNPNGVQIAGAVIQSIEMQERSSFANDTLDVLEQGLGSMTNQNARISLDMSKSMLGNTIKTCTKISSKSIDISTAFYLTELFEKINKIETASLDTEAGIIDYIVNLFHNIGASKYIGSNGYKLIEGRLVDRNLYWILAGLYTMLMEDKFSKDIEKEFLDADNQIELRSLSKLVKAFKAIGHTNKISCEERISLEILSSLSFESIMENIVNPMVTITQTLGQVFPGFVATTYNPDLFKRMLEGTLQNRVMLSPEERVEAENLMQEQIQQQQNQQEQQLAAQNQ